MADTTFVDGETRIATEWLQDINDFVYGAGFYGTALVQTETVDEVYEALVIRPWVKYTLQNSNNVSEFATNASLTTGLLFRPYAEGGMSVALMPGRLFVKSTQTLYELPVQSVTLTAPTTDPRIDRIVIGDSTGGISTVTGTEAPSPTHPDIPIGNLPIANIYLYVGMTEILDNDITDERTPFMV